jgi:hypothetical protein
MEIEIFGFEVENVEWIVILWGIIALCFHKGFAMARVSVVKELERQVSQGKLTQGALEVASHNNVSSLWFSEILGILIMLLIVWWIVNNFHGIGRWRA